LSEYTYSADKFVFRVRKDLLYSSDDVWVRPEPDGAMRVGLTDFAQRRSGDVVFAEASPAGTKMERGGLLGSYETIKVVQDILSPVAGTVVEVNPLLNSRPEAMNSDPYGEGWISIIRPEPGTGGLLSAEEYFEQMKTKVENELKKIKGL
jgi:glycine cleavage system H protein